VTLKKIVFQGNSLDVLRSWPESAKKLAGHRLARRRLKALNNAKWLMR